MDLIKERCLRNYVPAENLSYDESMIKYFGRHGCKQFMRNKPIRFGYKAWCLNTSSGYLINFEVYQGKNPRSKPKYETVFGKCTAPMIQFVEELPPEKRKLPYNLYFDNLFNSQNVMAFLQYRGLSGTGTVREKRIRKCVLKKKKSLQKR